MNSSSWQFFSPENLHAKQKRTPIYAAEHLAKSFINNFYSYILVILNVILNKSSTLY